jgi:hypothetical protein
VVFLVQMLFCDDLYSKNYLYSLSVVEFVIFWGDVANCVASPFVKLKGVF